VSTGTHALVKRKPRARRREPTPRIRGAGD